MGRELERVILDNEPGVWWMDERLHEFRSCDPNVTRHISFDFDTQMDSYFQNHAMNARPLVTSGLEIGHAIANGTWVERTEIYGFASHMLDDDIDWGTECPAEWTDEQLNEFIETLILGCSIEPKMWNREDVVTQVKLAIADLTLWYQVGS